ncbi:endodeoxyribonuclease, variant 3 [Puccinia graminis f. sp. tritici]|uniref:DNA topoisomerase (ATP-hydrolyzing) n=1 Tax=Puccinia graminis f. sp. tritici TaxID=56615 RepID=A0A5B0M8E0_PUCGR|nr:endodeoxyribonuclease, variant 3 [Puccinia graminis f. sp. tritici]
MLSSDSNEVESILSWTSEERRSEPARPADSTGSSWPDDQAESILDVDEGSSTWSGVERFSDDAQVESDFQELVDHDSVSTKSSDKQHGSLEKDPEKHRKLRFPRDTRNRSSGSGIRELSQLLRVLELSHDAILGKMIMTKRDVFYNDVNLFKKQVVVDRLVDDLAATFEITRGQLHFAASPKGLFQGDLELVIIGDTITSGHGPPALIPPEDTIKELKPGANIRFILIVEKEATFNMLVNMDFTTDPRLGPSLLICGIGYPSLSTRQLASRLSEHQEVVKRRVPILILVDCDPHGLDIAKVYKFGSQSMSFHPGLRAKQAEWIGISSSDWNEFSSVCFGGY